MTRLFVEGAGFAKRAEQTEVTVDVVDGRVRVRIGSPYDVRLTAAEAHVLASILLNEARFASC